MLVLFVMRIWDMYSKAKGLPEKFDAGKLKAGTEDVDIASTKNVKWAIKLGSQSYGNPVVTGGFDTVDGSVEARFNGTNRVTAGEYESSLAGKIQVGGQVRAETIPGGLLIKFHYFGDR